MSSYMHFRNGRMTGSSHSPSALIGMVLVGIVLVVTALTHFWITLAIISPLVGLYFWAKWEYTRDAEDEAQAMQAESDRLRFEANRKD